MTREHLPPSDIKKKTGFFENIVDATVHTAKNVYAQLTEEQYHEREIDESEMPESVRRAVRRKCIEENKSKGKEWRILRYTEEKPYAETQDPTITYCILTESQNTALRWEPHQMWIKYRTLGGELLQIRYPKAEIDFCPAPDNTDVHAAVLDKLQRLVLPTESIEQQNLDALKATGRMAIIQQEFDVQIIPRSLQTAVYASTGENPHTHQWITGQAHIRPAIRIPDMDGTICATDLVEFEVGRHGKTSIDVFPIGSVADQRIRSTETRVAPGSAPRPSTDIQN